MSQRPTTLVLPRAMSYPAVLLGCAVIALVSCLLASVPCARAQLAGGGPIGDDGPPPVVSEARTGIEAEQLLFQAADRAYPGQYNISFTYARASLPQGIAYRVGWHGTPTAQGTAVPFGDLMMVHTYDTPNSSLLQQSWSSSASEMSGMASGVTAFRYEGVNGVIYGVATLCMGVPAASSPLGTLRRLDIVATTTSEQGAVEQARALAEEMEAACAAEWLAAGFPAHFLAGSFNAANRAAPATVSQPEITTVPTPVPMFSFFELHGLPVIVSPPGGHVDTACKWYGSTMPVMTEVFGTGPRELPYIIKPRPEDNDFIAEVVVVRTRNPCVTGDAGWRHRLSSKGNRSRGRFFFQADIDDAESAHDPCGGNDGFANDSFSHSVLWSVKFMEAIPLSFNLGGFTWDLTGVPANVLYDSTLVCNASVCCWPCCP